MSIGDLPHLYDPLRPEVVYEAMNLEFGPEFRLVDVFIEPGEIEEIHLDHPISMVPRPFAIGNNGPMSLAQIDNEPYDGGIFPLDWGTYSIGRGLNSMDEPTVYLNFFCYPLRVQDNVLFYTKDIFITFTHYDKKIHHQTDSRSQPSLDARLVIIGPSSLSSSINDLVTHKQSLGLSTKFVTTDDIYSGTFFTAQGRDNPEMIKYFIKNAVENWNTKFVLLFGDSTEVPPFYVPFDDGYGTQVPVDVYYADIYGSTGGFSNWDNAQGTTGSFTMPDDLYLDVHVGRLPASTVSEADIIVDKVIHYETDSDKSWFKNAVLIGSDPFTWATGAEGDIGMDYIASKIKDDFPAPTKLYHANGLNSATQITNAINIGAGIMSYAGHGSNTYLAIGGGNSFTKSQAAALTNGYKLPIGSQAACSTGTFDQSYHSYAEEFVLTAGGGGIANMGASRVAYGAGGNSWPFANAGALNNKLYSSLVSGHLTAGSMYTGGHTNYLNTIGVNGGTDLKTLIEFEWFADPSMLIGVGADFSVETPGMLMPGEQNTFNLTVNNTGMALPLDLTTDTNQLPESWDVTFFPKSVVVPSGGSMDIKVQVTPDKYAPANTQFDLPIQIEAPTLGRILFSDTVKVKVEQVFDMSLTSEYPVTGVSVDPGNSIDVEVNISNEGNGPELVDLLTEDVPADWDVYLSSNQVSMGLKENSTVTMTVTIPDHNPPGSNSLLLKGNVAQDPSKTDERLFNVNINTIHNWTVLEQTDDQAIDMGRTAVFDIELVNNGNIDEVIELSLNGPPRWIMTVDDTVHLDPYSTRTIQAIVITPEFEYVGNYSLSLTAENKITGETLTLGLGLGINAAPKIVLSTFDPIVDIGYMGNEEAGLLIENQGNTHLDIGLAITDSPEGWDVELDKETLSIPAQESTYATISISNPEFTLAGSYPITVQATTTYGDIDLMNETEVVVIVDQVTDAKATIKETSFRIDPGESLTAVITLENNGNVLETFNDFSAITPDGWVVSMDREEITVDPFSMTDLQVKLTSSEDALEGPYRSTIFIKNGASSFMFPLDIAINQIYGFEGEMNALLVELLPKDLAYVQLNLTNNGNGVDDLNLELTSESWVMLDRTKVTIDPGATETIKISIAPDKKVKSGDYPISIKATSEGGDEADYNLAVTVKEVPSIIGANGSSLLGLLAGLALVVIAIISVAIIIQRRKNENGSITPIYPLQQSNPNRIDLLDVEDISVQEENDQPFN